MCSVCFAPLDWEIGMRESGGPEMQAFNDLL